MSKKEIVVRIFFSLTVLILSAILQVYLSPKPKRIQEMEAEFEKVKKIAARIPEMQKNNPGFNTNLSALLASMKHTITTKTPRFIDEIYSGLLESTKKGNTVENYFIEQNKAVQLKVMLAKYILYINKNIRGEENFKKGSLLDLDYKNSKGNKVSWEIYYFGKCTKKTAILT